MTAVRPLAPQPRRALYLGLLGVACFGAHWISFLFPEAERVLMAVWPAGGIGLAALLLSSRRQWPANLVVLFLAGHLANLMAGRPALASLGFMTATVLESLTCALVLQRWCGERLEFTRVREIIALLGAATLANAGTAVMGAATSLLTSGASFWEFYWTWWVANGLGILLVTPLLVCWTRAWRLQGWSTRQRYLEALVLLTLSAGSAWLTFELHDTHAGVTMRPYMLLGFVAWAAWRFGPRGTATLLAATALIALHLTATGRSCFPLGGHDAPHRLLMVQIFLAVASAIGMLLAASQAEQRATAVQLRDSEAFLNRVFESSPTSMWIADAQGTLLRANQALCRLLHVRAEELVGKYNVLADPLVEAQGFLPRVRAVFAEGQSTRFIIRYDTAAVPNLDLREKTSVILDVSLVPILDPQGRVIHAIIEHIDITEQQRAAEALRESERRFAAFFRTSPVSAGISRVEDGAFLDVNEAFLNMFGYTRDEVLGHSATELALWPVPEQRECLMKRLAEEGRVHQWEADFRRKSGETGRAVVSAEFVELSGQQYMFGMISDISERKRMELAIRTSLEEKTALLREIHHRVKNNLQVVASLLSLKAAQIKEPEIQAVLRDLHNRVHSMGLLHETLYRSGNLAHIHLPGYVRNVCDHLSRAVGPRSDRVRLEYRIGDLFLGLDQAVPCGLIINELVTNALKYAFVDGRAGLIRVGFEQLDPGQMVLSVVDNGIGLPPGPLSAHRESLGLRLVDMLVQQLQGTLRLTRRSGTSFEIAFKTNAAASSLTTDS